MGGGDRTCFEPPAVGPSRYSAIHEGGGLPLKDNLKKGGQHVS
jgi:hypothetical protein